MMWFYVAHVWLFLTHTHTHFSFNIKFFYRWNDPGIEKNRKNFYFFHWPSCDLGHTHIAKHNFNEIIFSFFFKKNQCMPRRNGDDKNKVTTKFVFAFEFQNWNTLENWVPCKCFSVCVCIRARKKGVFLPEKNRLAKLVPNHFITSPFSILSHKIRTVFSFWIDDLNEKM